MQVPFKRQMRVEVVDKTHLCRTRVALVEQVRLSAGVSSGLMDVVLAFMRVWACRRR